MRVTFLLVFSINLFSFLNEAMPIPENVSVIAYRCLVMVLAVSYIDAFSPLSEPCSTDIECYQPMTQFCSANKTCECKYGYTRVITEFAEACQGKLPKT